jgi:hypothetical protein
LHRLRAAPTIGAVMTTTAIRGLVLSVCLMSAAACKDEPAAKPTATPTATTASATAPASAAAPAAHAGVCKAYVEAMEACKAKQPEDQRASWQKQIDAQRKAMESASSAGKKQMSRSCLIGLNTVKRNPSCK